MVEGCFRSNMKYLYQAYFSYFLILLMIFLFYLGISRSLVNYHVFDWFMKEPTRVEGVQLTD